MLTPGSILQGRYVIECDIGRGGMGVVYRGRHELLGSRVAIKEMQFGATDDRDQAIRHFQREARLLATAGGHANLVRAVDCFEEGGRLYLVMDFVDGRDLAAVINASPDYLPVAQVLHWVDQVCDVLEYLHALQPPIIYRDLKPSNVMVDGANRVRLIDFGIARTFQADAKVTSTGAALSPGYGALEQYGVGTVDPRTDVYGLGATLYSLLTRRLPPTAVDMASGAATLVPPSLVNPTLPPALDGLIAEMMALRAVDRCPSVAVARQRLRAVMGTVEPPALRGRFCDDCGTPLGEGARCPQCDPAPPTVTPPSTPAGDSIANPPPAAGNGSAAVAWTPLPNPLPRAGSGSSNPLSEAGNGSAPPAWTPPNPLPPAGVGPPAWRPSDITPDSRALPPVVHDAARPPGTQTFETSVKDRPAGANRLLQFFLFLLIVGGIAGAIYFARKDPDEAVSGSNIDPMGTSSPAAPATASHLVPSQTIGNSMSLAGSRWSGVDSDGDHYTYWFKRGGLFDYTSPGGHADLANVSWSQDGAHVEWSMNKYSMYRATLAGDEMRAEASNPTGKKWTVTLHRDPDMPPAPDGEWRGTDSEGDHWTMTLEHDGSLKYSGRTEGQGRWSLDDKGWTVDIDLNGYSTWTGTVDGRTLFGTAQNKTGKKWTWSAIRP